MLKVGDRLVLHSTPVPGLPSETPDTFVEITVEKSRGVGGTYDPKTFYTGFKAKDKEGHLYFCNWNSFDEASSSPYTSWFRGTEFAYEGIWWDVTAVGTLPAKPSNDLFKTFKILSYCLKHRILYYNKEGCYKCEHKMPDAEPPELQRVPWNGWYNKGRLS